MALIDEVTAVARAQGNAAAVSVVEGRAAGGDPAALALLGQWRIWGLYGERDLAAGRAALTAAAEAGDADSAMTLSALLATGTGGPPDLLSARHMLERIGEESPMVRRILSLTELGQRPIDSTEALRADPFVGRIARLLSPEECLHLVETADPMMRPSTVIDPVTRRRIANPVRDSDGWAVMPPQEDLAIHAINQRIADATGTEWWQGEPLHLLRYRPGQQYRPHCDALPGVSNQRVLTAIIYLNDDYEGGETAFDGGLSVRGGIGDVLLFANVDGVGRADPRTRHAGTPVIAGVKWIATRWIRAEPYDPWVIGS